LRRQFSLVLPFLLRGSRAIIVLAAFTAFTLDSRLCAAGFHRADARTALQSFRSSCSPRNVAVSSASSRNSRLVQSSNPEKYRVIGSAIPLCRWPFPRLCGFPSTGPRWTLLSDQCTLSASSAFLQSLAQPDLANRPQPVGSSLGLLLPTALEGPEVHIP
jgi:hypothetical protein